ncbi:MAG: hypothetical protein EPO24_09140 [Bacteroidetes bacterium]|nr:MAG: hypothetical protein EPO24_09140 [Bacteroidota bacterium]
MVNNTNQSLQKSDAVFLGWQKHPNGTLIPLYTIIATDHPSYGSTVSENTLRNFNLQVPQASLPIESVKKF